MTAPITRHYVDIVTAAGARRVHYRKCGSTGPTLLMAHQSPRSSAEYEPLMREWSRHFTCIAPDTPGFGQSDRLARPEPGIEDYADAIVEFIDAMGLAGTLAYGFHSGGIILVTALRRHPDRFRALAIGGYAIWTPQEVALFGQNYLPHFLPSAYGEHLTWLWNRMLEQTWFFPWFDTRNETRMSVAQDDPAYVHGGVIDMLDAGNAYRDGYGAVINAPRDIPAEGDAVPPCLITAYNGDPLQAHIDRLGAVPSNWEARKVATPADHYAASAEFLLAQGGVVAGDLPETHDAGFVAVRTAAFDGLIHWSGRRNSEVLTVHAPARSGALVDAPGSLVIDLPGHGLSHGWIGAAPSDWAPWQEVIDAVAAALGASRVAFEPLPEGDAERLYPDLSPDRHGAYLTRAWNIVRAERFFAPWYVASKATAIPFSPDAITPEDLAKAHLARLRGVAAAACHRARQAAGIL